MIWREYQRQWISDRSRLAIAVKSAQIGYSVATAAWAIDACLERPNHLVVFISRSERQAIELARKAKLLVDALSGVEAQLAAGPFAHSELLESMIRFSNGSRIIALSSDPETARGYTGDVVLDEFGFHPQSEEIFKVAMRQITLGHRMRVLSTPNGQQGKFFDLAKKCGVAEGEPSWLKSKILHAVNGWSAHWCDIYRARREGFPVDPETLRSGCDDFIWRQEYCCEFLSSDLLWIPPQLLEPAVSIECPMGPPFGEGPYFAGWDIARHRDLSIIWFFQPVGNMRLTAGVAELSGLPTPEQIEQARAWMPMIDRIAIDCTGMGLTIFETLHKQFPDQVEGITFTGANKEKLASGIRLALENHLLKVPDAQVIRRSFGSIRRGFTATGQARFDAEHDSISRHGDHFWAAALALAAGEKITPGLFGFLQKTAEEQKKNERPTAQGPRELPKPDPPSVQERMEFSRKIFDQAIRGRR